MIKNILSISLLIASIFIADVINAQIAKTVVAEHFTNTWCGTCSFRNPNLWNTLAATQNANVIHISYHPSSPYPQCTLNQNDVAANDARVNYYNQFGSTPRLMVNGVDLISSSNWNNANMFDTYLTETSAIEIDLPETIMNNNNQIDLNVTIKNVQDHNLSDLVLFAALAEDTLFFNSPNGEDVHHNVFRQAFTNMQGEAIAITNVVNEESTFNYTLNLNTDGNVERFFAYVIVQNSVTKEIVQSAKMSSNSIVEPVSIENYLMDNISFYPNPVKDILNLEVNDLILENAKIYNLEGAFILNYSIENNKINLSNLNAGIYFIKISTNKGDVYKKVIRE